MSPPLTPNEFAAKMREIYPDPQNRNTYAVEDSHAEADDLMADLLIALGYEEGMEIFAAAVKWYA